MTLDTYPRPSVVERCLMDAAEGGAPTPPIPMLRAYWADTERFRAVTRAESDSFFADHDARQRAKQKARWAAEGDI